MTRFLKKIINKISELNGKTTDPFKYDKESFLFFRPKAMTFVWIENDDEN